MSKQELPLAKKNYIIMGIALALIVIGFMLMIGGENNNPEVFNAEELYSFRRVTLSVIVALAGFGLMIYGIMYRKKEKQ